MRIVISGATSMIGVALIKECIKNKCDVLAIVRKNTSRIGRIPESEFVHIEYADLDSITSVKGDGNPYDVFYHFAWGHTVKEERDDPFAQEDNIRTTLQAVELAHKLGCQKFIGAGSQAEFGPVNGIISADTRPEPVTAYGMAKLSAGMMSKKRCEQLGMTHIWGRIFSVYGCNDNAGTMIDYAIHQFQRGEVAEFSSATQMWNYLNEEDAGKIFYLFGDREIESGVYCVANNESRVLREYIEEVKEAFGKDVQCEFAAPGENDSVFGLEADIQKTIDAIDYVPQVTFKEGIMQILNGSKKKLGGRVKHFLLYTKKTIGTSGRGCAA